MKDKADIERLCERLICCIRTPLIHKGIELTVGVSIGAATYPSSGTTSSNLRIKADDLMYQVKKSGKNNFLINDQEVNA